LSSNSRTTRDDVNSEREGTEDIIEAIEHIIATILRDFIDTIKDDDSPAGTESGFDPTNRHSSGEIRGDKAGKLG